MSIGGGFFRTAANVLSQLAGSGGSALVGYIGSLTGAVAKTVRTKLRERLSPENDAGGTGDGVADDTTPVSRVMAAARAWVSSATASYLIEATNLTADKSLFGVRFVGKHTNAETLRSSGTVTDVALIGVEVDATAAGTAYQHNTANGARMLVVGSRLRAKGYSYLANSYSGGTDGVILAASVFDSAQDDGIELNTTSGTPTKNFAIVGNLIKGGPSGSSGSSGFGVGIAKTQGVAVVGNIVQEARHEAVHVEDAQHEVTITGNVLASCTTEAFRLLNKTGNGPVIFSSNTALHSGSKTGVAGVRIVYDGRGYRKFNQIIGNVMSGFGIGFKLEGAGVQLMSGNVAHSCDLGYLFQAAAVVPGVNGASGCTALAEAGGGAIIGGLVTETNYANPLTKTGTNFPGPVLKNLSMPFGVDHAGGGAEDFVICALPSRFTGRIMYGGATGTQSFFFAATVVWDGAALTVSDSVSRFSGSFIGATLAASGGNLVARVSCNVDQASITARVDVDGYWYVHS